MKNKITSTEIKSTNKKNIYTTIYRQGQVSKQQLADTLGLSMPTITHNLKELEELDLIQKDGQFSSSASGGRKASILCCNRTARIAVGVEVLKDTIHIVAVDLYGVTISRSLLELPFECSTLYYCALGNWVNSFIADLPYPRDAVLGVGIAVQGLVSSDHQTITYGEILNCTGLTLQEFSQYIKYPCIFIHDTEAAASTEIFRNYQITDMLYILINKTLGGTLVIDGKIHGKSGQMSGLLEHMCLYPDGKPCYCGKKGCADSYCSLNAILAESQDRKASEFFRLLRSGDARREEIWQRFLHNLALTINNAIRIVDCNVVISGQLSTYLTTKDMAQLRQYVHELDTFPLHRRVIRLGPNQKDIAAIGAALQLVTSFLETSEVFQ